MTLFVHIADARDAAAIRRNGLKLPRWRGGTPGEGVFATPVIANFQITHQWLRELKRRGFKTAMGVYFRIPDHAEVLAGRYNEHKLRMTAAEATALLRRTETLGFETIVPRSIAANEIVAIRALPQNIGWRYEPGAHERGVFCGCEYCQRGNIKSRKIREAYRARFGV